METHQDRIFKNLDKRKDVFLLESRGSFGYLCFTFKTENLVSLSLITNPFAGRPVLARCVGSGKMISKSINKTSAASSVQTFSVSAIRFFSLFCSYLSLGVLRKAQNLLSVNLTLNT